MTVTVCGLAGSIKTDPGDTLQNETVVAPSKTSTLSKSFAPQLPSTAFPLEVVLMRTLADALDPCGTVSENGVG